MHQEGDPYEVLGLARGASEEEIRRAYKQLAVQNHPDRNSDPEAVETFKRVTQAYATLSDPLEKQIWDAQPGKSRPESAARHPAAGHQTRKVTPDEKARQEEFRQKLAESLVTAQIQARNSSRRHATVNAICGLVLISWLVYLSRSSALLLPFSYIGTDPGPGTIFFWVTVGLGYWLAVAPDSGEEVFAGLIPPPVLELIGWLTMLGITLTYWLVSQTTVF